MDNVEYIQTALSGADRAAQLAEEATELAHAALKLERVLRGTNPTPVTRVKAIDKVLEETADVLCALEVLNIRPDNEAINDIQSEKMERWAERLRKKEAEAQYGI